MVKYQNDGKFAYFNGEKFCRDDSTGYYLSSITRNGKRKRLHIAVWEYSNGEIRKGMQVHHRDLNKSNNDIDNLELKTAFSHMSLHSKLASPEHMKKFHDAGIEAAKEWHKSREGLEWHRKHYEKFKDKLYEKKEYECIVCGSKYISVKSAENKFCSNNCKSAYRRKLGIDNEERICVVCGNKFTANKYRKTKCCSRKCGGIARRKTMQDKKY